MTMALRAIRKLKVNVVQCIPLILLWIFVAAIMQLYLLWNRCISQNLRPSAEDSLPWKTSTPDSRLPGTTGGWGKLGSAHQEVPFLEHPQEKANRSDSCTEISFVIRMEKSRKRQIQAAGETLVQMRSNLRYELEQITSRFPILTPTMKPLQDEMESYYKQMALQLEAMANADVVERKRQRGLQKLQEALHKELNHLQNPENCEEANLLECVVEEECPLSRRLRQEAVCLMAAFAARRTLILYPRAEEALHGPGKVFLPLSPACDIRSDATQLAWDDPQAHQAKVMTLHLTSSNIKYFSQIVPLTDNVLVNLDKYHRQPAIWLSAQFLLYVARPIPPVARVLGDALIGLRSPVVGLYAENFSLQTLRQYRIHVDDYFSSIYAYWPFNPHRVFLATQDPNATPFAKKILPDYVLLTPSSVSDGVGFISKAAWNSSGLELLLIHLLSHTDYLVCPASSEVCLTAFELMHTFHSDAIQQVKFVATVKT